MIARTIIVASLLGTGAAPAPAELPAGSAAESAHVVRCTISPGAAGLAIKTKGTSAQRGQAASDHAINTKGTGANSGRAASIAVAAWSRIDLHLAGAPGGSGPAITAFAINTKGTGTSAGRAASDHAINTKGTGTSSGRAAGDQAISEQGSAVNSKRLGPTGEDCDDAEIAGDAAARKAAAADFAFLDSAGRGVGYACSVAGTEEQPVFTVGLLVPTILGQAERQAAGAASRAESWSWGVSNSNHRVSIVPRSAEYADDWHIACSSKEPRSSGYDLAVLKK